MSVFWHNFRMALHAPLPPRPSAPPAPRRIHPQPGARARGQRQRPDLPGVCARRPGPARGRGLHARRGAPEPGSAGGRRLREAGHSGDGPVPGDQCVTQRPGGQRGRQPRRLGAHRGALAKEGVPRPGRDDRRGTGPFHQPRPGRPAGRHRLHPERQKPSRCW